MFTFTNKQRAILLSIFTAIFVAVSGFWYNFQSKDSIQISSRFAEDSSGEMAIAGRNTILSAAGETASSSVMTEYIYVHVKGAVNKPGVYSLEKGARVVDAIQAAGGEDEEANLELINLASKLQDGQEVYVYRDVDLDKAPINIGAASNQPSIININTASSQDLQTLPGIGSAKADTIIKYREKNGPFSSVEDLLKISGIGPKTLEAFIDDIDAY